MKLSTTARVLAVACLGGLCGCVPGYNSLLFYTKTNVGLIVETQPPEVSLDIGRQEGLLAPSYEAGKTPPVMASFRFDSHGFLSNYIGSSFSTGDAAVTMSRLYSAPDWPDAEGKKAWNLTAKQWRDKEWIFNSAIPLHKLPVMPWFVPKEKAGAVRPVLFGTDTSYGFKVAWKNPESPVPDYLRLAYQRRELAFAAVTIGLARDVDGKLLRDKKGKLTNQLEANVPSLLSTVDTSLELREPWKSRFEYLQYFASGRAATALAFRFAVRKAMLSRLDPEQWEAVKQYEIDTEYNRVTDAQQKKIEACMADPAKLLLLRAHLDSIGVSKSVSITGWSSSGARSKEELDAAIMAGGCE